jgi:rubrerythrin
MQKKFRDLQESEVLALAITLEEEDGRIYRDFAARLTKDFPSAAQLFSQMAEEESHHRHQLLEAYRARFGEHVPLIRREDVRGFVRRSAFWLFQPLKPEKMREEAASMELETRRFYEHAAGQTTDAGIRQLLGDLARVEGQHEQLAARIEEKQEAAGLIEEESHAAKRLFVLRVVQPGLAGLMDGSVSTLAPLFAAAFATGSSWDAFRVGLAASVGAGISMGFAEALSDDGELSGRGGPLLRGFVCGLMTTAGGIGHTLPYLIPDFRIATAVAIGVVGIELGVIAWVRHRFMETPWLGATLQVVLGGVLVFLAGVLIGKS